MKTTKKIRITFPCGDIFDVPVHIIAAARAKYYANNDLKHGRSYDKTYKAEYEYTSENDDEILDWVQNNTNWDDLEKFAVKVDVEIEKVDYKLAFSSCDFEILKK